jgi:peptide chain release factor subunit 1
MRKVLGVENDTDEREHFDNNVKLVEKYLKGNPLKSGSLCIFVCWILDFFEACIMEAPIKDIVILDSSPYIRPLAELQDEYENTAVVVADNKKAKIYLISSLVAGPEESVTGNIKNHVKKGGWSQQRYERRRDKEIIHYAKEIIDALLELDKNESFRRIVLAGGKEIIQAIEKYLPQNLKPLVSSKALDIKSTDNIINQEIMDMLTERERDSEKTLWKKIQNEYLRDNLGLAGLNDVFDALMIGNVEQIIVERNFKPEGWRCRDCENLLIQETNTCPACRSKSLFQVDLINEMTELVKQYGGDIDFTDPIPELTEAGQIAAFLRFKY